MEEDQFWAAMVGAGYMNRMARNPDDIVALPMPITYQDLPTVTK
jgi:hypothetical protein